MNGAADGNNVAREGASRKKAVMYGAGNIGRGFIGQLFYLSGYDTVFIDVVPALVEKLETDRRYPVRIVEDGKYDEVYVENVRAVSGADLSAVSSEIAEADIMATAVGVNVLPKIIGPIAEGLRKRWEQGNYRPLNIIICENLLDANHYIGKLLKDELDEHGRRLFGDTVGLVEASIGRMVPVMTPEMQGDNILRIWVEPYNMLPVDKDAFKGGIPDIVNMVPFSPFGFYIRRKLFMHNMGHAALAYLGFLRNCRYIWEARRDPLLRLTAMRALTESAVAMSKEYGVSIQTLLEFAENLVYRFGNRLLGDTIDRVGRDPVRKLASNDRLAGAASLCLKQGVFPVYIALGIAAGYMFAPEGDPSADKVRTAVKSGGIESALKEYSGIDARNPLLETIVGFYNDLASGMGLETIIEKAEKMKNSQGVLI